MVRRDSRETRLSLSANGTWCGAIVVGSRLRELQPQRRYSRKFLRELQPQRRYSSKFLRELQPQRRYSRKFLRELQPRTPGRKAGASAASPSGINQRMGN